MIRRRVYFKGHEIVEGPKVVLSSMTYRSIWRALRDELARRDDPTPLLALLDLIEDPMRWPDR